MGSKSLRAMYESYMTTRTFSPREMAECIVTMAKSCNVNPHLVHKSLEHSHSARIAGKLSVRQPIAA